MAPRLRRLLATWGPTIGDATRETYFRVAHAQPPAVRTPWSTAAPLATTIERAAAFLRAQQGASGGWRDFLLPPGASTSWLTAHIAYVLEDVAIMDDALDRAATYLAHTGGLRDGWGYNERVPIDCDSTGQALLVLQRRASVTGFDRHLDWLLRSQTEKGGFPTYIRTDPTGWAKPHPDVTLAVADLLGRAGLRAQQRRALDWVESSSPPAPVASYWWNTDAYNLCLQSKVGHHRAPAAALARRRLRERRARSPETAMLLLAALADGPVEGTMMTAGRNLQRMQLADGSWPCAPCLRVTDPAEHELGAKLRGRVYAGRLRVFSTAYALAALARFAKALETSTT